MLNSVEHRRATGDRGVTIALVALVLVPLLAAAALAVDLGGWYARASEIQRSADAAALAGVTYLPQGIGQARAEAARVATRNGYTDGVNGVTVTVTDIGLNRLRVTITEPGVQQSISQMFRDDVTVTRSSTAEYIQPVPMGSPRNYLGTYRSPSPAATGIAPLFQENFWLSVSGYCARREHGDRITPRTDSNGGSFQSCVPSGGSGASSVIANPEFRDAGYFYAVEFKADYTGIASIEVFDAPHCQYESTGAGDSGADGSSASQRAYTWTLRSNNSLNPLDATPIGAPKIITPADCAAMSNRWQTLFSLDSPRQGIYFLQIQPVVPATQTGPAAQEGQNQFSLRIADSGVFTPCSSDLNIPPYVAGRNCPNVYGLTHLGVYAQGNGSNPSFYLASVGDEHSGKTMQIELFDTAEGAESIQIRDPSGADYPFTWEVACMDGSYRSENSGGCRTATGEVAPTPGYGPVADVMSLNVSGTSNAFKPWGPRNEQNGRYSDRLVRLTVRLPGHPLAPNPAAGDISVRWGGLTWWKIVYTVSGSGGVGDRTTWSINIFGDPVRLVPNT